MGSSFLATCEKCGHLFRVSDGGGFMFHLLHCNTCGKEKSISFEEIGEPHLKYLKGLSDSNDTATQENDGDVHANYPGPAICEKEYRKVVEEMAGHCECGGQFKFDAPPRCPECKSTHFKENPDGEYIFYD